MLIDWRTVAAQLINFLLLVWLLNKFLFKPILAIVQERDKKVREELESAARQQEEARLEQKTLTQEKETFHRERNTLFKNAIAEAEQEKEKLLNDARKEYTSLREALHTHVEEDKNRLFSELRGSIEDEAFGLARTALQNLSSASLEGQMVVRFAEKACQMDKKAKEQLLFDLARSSYAVTFKTAFELPSESRHRLETAFRELFGHPIACAYEQDPSLIGGIEMITSGHTVSWSLASSLFSIREAV